MGPLVERLSRFAQLEFPNGPHVCPASSVERLHRRLPQLRDDEEHRMWFRASDDVRTYLGWPETEALFADLLQTDEPTGLLGFSQGGIVASALCALSQHGRVPQVDFAVLIAGAPARSEELAAYFTAPIEIPSLHLIGRRDRVMGDAPGRLVECYSPRGRQQVIWEGGHVIPQVGQAADVLVDFVQDQTMTSANSR